MNRKSVILSGMVVLMTASTNLHAAESGTRQVQELDRGWRFRCDAPGGAKEPDFDDSFWEKVWNGVKDPALYRAAAEVWSEDRRIDRVEQSLGFRTFSKDFCIWTLER